MGLWRNVFFSFLLPDFCETVIGLRQYGNAIILDDLGKVEIRQIGSPTLLFSLTVIAEVDAVIREHTVIDRRIQIMHFFQAVTYLRADLQAVFHRDGLQQRIRQGNGLVREDIGDDVKRTRVVHGTDFTDLRHSANPIRGEVFYAVDGINFVFQKFTALRILFIES